jgi:hypothetical protein
METIHVVTNQALHDMIPNKEDILVNVEADNTVEVQMPHKDILMAFSMFNDRGIICFFMRKIL